MVGLNLTLEKKGREKGHALIYFPAIMKHILIVGWKLKLDLPSARVYFKIL
jgi:hypothetical protein